jgi:isopentenyl phosphate kinase
VDRLVSHANIRGGIDMTTTAREVIADSGRTIASGDDMTTYADKLEDADAIIVALDAAGFVIVFQGSAERRQ